MRSPKQFGNTTEYNKSMRTLAALLFCLTLHAQQLNLSLNPATVQSGGTTTATLTFQDTSPTDNITAVQWNAALPAGVSFGVAATVVANKSTTCNGTECVLAGTPDPTTHLVNVTPLVSGAVVTFPVTVTAKPGTAMLTLQGLSAANNLGSAVAITSTGATLTITGSKYDLDGNGAVDYNDAVVALRQVLGLVACTNANFLNDGCMADDLVLELRAVLGLP